MKAKLIKRSDVDYKLYVNEATFATSIESPYKRLSLKNCQAIELGYDLDELAKADADLRYNQLGQEELWLTRVTGIEYGFNLALELLGDKKFSEKELTILFAYGHQIGMNNILAIQSQHSPQPMPKPDSDKLRDELIQSLQQTEFDVEIEMECCGNYTPPCNNNCEYGSKPKLDADNCLILKRI